MLQRLVRTSFLLLSIVLCFCLLPAALTWGAGQITAPLHKVGGYCGVHGRIIKAGEKNCTRQHGIFFKDRKSAQTWLAGQQPGFCCAGGKVQRTKKIDCAKRKGAFFKTKKETDYYCDRHRKGFCCLSGKVLAMAKGACLDKKGRFWDQRTGAARFCMENQSGFCCLRGKIIAMKQGACKQKKGIFFKGKEAAAGFCKQHQKGFCIAAGRMEAMEQGECTRKKGKFFTSKVKASQAMTTRKSARSITSQQAQIGLDGKHPTPAPGSAHKTRAETKRPLTLAADPMHVLSSNSRTGLTIGKIYLKNNVIQVQLKKTGKGDLNQAPLSRGVLTLTAGKTKKKWPMSAVDPRHSLAAGNTVFFDTGVRLSQKTRVQAVLKRVDGNPQKTVWLTPMPGLVTQMHVVKPGKSTRLSPIAKPMAALGREQKKAGKTVRLDPVASAAIQAADKKPVPKRFDAGITVLQPTAGVYFPGQEITIEYRLPDRGDEGITALTVELRRDGDSGFHRTIELARVGSADETRSQAWNLPADLEEDTYFIAASLAAGGLFGYSDRFTVRRLFLAELHAVNKSSLSLSPDYPSYDLRESFTLTIHGSASSPFAVYLAPQGSSAMGFWYQLWDQSHDLHTGDDENYILDLRMPSSVNDEVEAWEVVVQNEDSSFLRSHALAIVPGIAASHGHFGEGGGSTTTLRLYLSSPRAGDYFPDESYMRTIPLRWTYRGPARTCPRNWLVRLSQEGHPDREYDWIRPERTEEVEPEIPGLDHTWTMRKDLMLEIPAGNYSLQISAGDFNADSSGTFYLGPDPDRPLQSLITAPAIGSHYFAGDTIEVAWRTYPAPPAHEQRYWPRIICEGRVVDMGNESEYRQDRQEGIYRISSASVTINPEATASHNCRVVVRSTIPGRSEINGEQFTILPAPAEGIDRRDANFSLGPFHLNENGHLIITVQSRGFSSPFTIPFFIGSSGAAHREPASLRRVEREIPPILSTSIDLGHIDTLINGEERHLGPRRWITVKVNMPQTVVPEVDFTDNARTQELTIWPVSLILRNRSLQCYSHVRDGDLSAPPRFTCGREGRMSYFLIYNHGYATASGHMTMRLTGTTGYDGRGRRERTILTSRDVSIPGITETGNNNIAIRPSLTLNNSGTSIRSGDIEVIFSGDLRPLDTITIPLERR